MKPDTSPSEVREFERYKCRLDASAAVAPGNSERTAFSRNAGDGSGVVRCVIVDCSTGGFAVESEAFFPRAARVRVAVPVPGGPPLELDVAVRRATMIGRKPLYNLGMSVLEPVGAQDGAVRRLLALAKASVRGATGSGGVSGA